MADVGVTLVRPDVRVIAARAEVVVPHRHHVPSRARLVAARVVLECLVAEMKLIFEEPRVVITCRHCSRWARQRQQCAGGQCRHGSLPHSPSFVLTAHASPTRSCAPVATAVAVAPVSCGLSETMLPPTGAPAAVKKIAEA